jgi:hypothetical protein
MDLKRVTSSPAHDALFDSTAIPTSSPARAALLDSTTSPNFDGIITKAVYSIGEVLSQVPIGRSKLYEEIKADRLHVTKCGRRSMVLAPDFKGWLTTLRGVAR